MVADNDSVLFQRDVADVCDLPSAFSLSGHSLFQYFGASARVTGTIYDL